MKEKKKLSLPIKIFIGMALGIVAGLICAFANLGAFTKEWIKPIGTIYVNLLKFLVVPVVLFSIADGVISLNDLKRVGSVGLKTFIYYMFTTALAVVIGLVLVNLFKGNFTPLPSAELGELAYELIGEEGPDHNKIFTSQVRIGGKAYGTGRGRTKKLAEQDAAYRTILDLNNRSKTDVLKKD